MNCPEICKKIPEYLENALDPQERNRFEKHLKKCSDCQRELEVYNKTWNVLGIWENELEPGIDFLPGIWEKIEQPTLADRIKSVFTFQLPAWAMLLAAVLGLWLGQFWTPVQVVEGPERIVYIRQNSELALGTENLIMPGTVDEILPEPGEVFSASENNHVELPGDSTEIDMEEAPQLELDPPLERVDPLEIFG